MRKERESKTSCSVYQASQENQGKSYEKKIDEQMLLDFCINYLNSLTLQYSTDTLVRLVYMTFSLLFKEGGTIWIFQFYNILAVLIL